MSAFLFCFSVFFCCFSFYLIHCTWNGSHTINIYSNYVDKCECVSELKWTNSFSIDQNMVLKQIIFPCWIFLLVLHFGGSHDSTINQDWLQAKLELYFFVLYKPKPLVVRKIKGKYQISKLRKWSLFLSISNG